MVILTGRAGSTRIVNDSVSVAPTLSRTRTVNVNVPTVVGRPLTNPEPTPCVCGPVMPGGIWPDTRFHCTGAFDVRQPVVDQNYVWRSPTL